MKHRSVLYPRYQQRKRRSIPIAVLGRLTRMVKVALSCDTGVALCLVIGIWRSVFPSTVAKKRACIPNFKDELSFVHGMLASGFRASGFR